MPRRTRIADLRVERGLSRRELARRVRYSERYVRAVESGAQAASDTLEYRLARALDVPRIDLYLAPPQEHVTLEGDE